MSNSHRPFLRSHCRTPHAGVHDPASSEYDELIATHNPKKLESFRAPLSKDTVSTKHPGVLKADLQSVLLRLNFAVLDAEEWYFSHSPTTDVQLNSLPTFSDCTGYSNRPAHKSPLPPRFRLGFSCRRDGVLLDAEIIKVPGLKVHQIIFHRLKGDAEM